MSVSIPVQRTILLAAPVEYCASPFRNPVGVPPVDCDALWGTR